MIDAIAFAESLEREDAGMPLPEIVESFREPHLWPLDGGPSQPRGESHDSRPIHSADDRKIEGHVNTPSPRPKRWTHVRVPVELAERLTALAGEMLIAHGEGRITLPNSMVQFVPSYHVIVKALDEQEARRERSARPRARRPR